MDSAFDRVHADALHFFLHFLNSFGEKASIHWLNTMDCVIWTWVIGRIPALIPIENIRRQDRN
jgi:hypothetical protein